MSSTTPSVIQNRLSLIDQHLKLTEETLRAMQRIRQTVATAAAEVDSIIASLPHDTGRRIATIDALQAVKDLAITSILLSSPGLGDQQMV